MEFIEGSRGLYRPIRVLFETPIYERAKQICWHTQAFKTKVAFMTELLHLQQNNQLPPEVTAEAMSDLMVRDSQKTLRVQLWDFELEDFDEEVKPLLKLVWEVNTSMMRRDVEFKAKRLLDSPDAMPSSFRHPKITSQAHEYGRILIQQLQRAPDTRKLSPQEVVVDLVPKVLQGFWRPKKTVSRDMPSEKLCEMAVSVTKAVLDQVSASLSTTLHQVNFPRSVRDDMVHAIDHKVRQKYPEDTLRRKLNSFEVEVLNIITSVTAKSICVLFEPQTQEDRPADQPPDVPAVQDTENISQGTPSPAALQDLPAEPCTQELSSEPESNGQTLSPPANLPTSLPAEADVIASVLKGEVMEGQSTREPEPAAMDLPAVNEPSAITQVVIPVQTHLPLVTLPAEPPVVVSVLEDEDKKEEQTTKPDSAGRPPSPPASLPTVASIPASVLEGEVVEGQSTQTQDRVPKSRIQRFFRRLKKRICCCVLPQDDH